MLRIFREHVDPQAGKGVVTIGAFDGIHRGHQDILRRLVQVARELKARARVLSFYPHPDVVLGKVPSVRLLTTLRQKVRLLEAAGVDELFLVRFTPKLAGLSALSFVERYLLKEANAEYLVLGPDTCVGRGREANAIWLCDKLIGLGGGGEIVAPLLTEQGGEEISSDLVRRTLAEGNVARVRSYLGRSFSLEGRVVKGESRGRALGFRTANLDCTRGPTAQCIPAYGVYFASVHLGGQIHRAVVNVGRRPTFGVLAELVEAHLINYSGPEFYGKRIEIEFIQRLRDERRFSSREELVSQIADDVARARTLD